MISSLLSCLKIILISWICQNLNINSRFFNNLLQNVIRVLPSFSNWLRRLEPSLSNSIVVYKRDFFQNIASENSQDALGVKNAFSYVDMGKLEGSNPKANCRVPFPCTRQPRFTRSGLYAFRRLNYFKYLLIHVWKIPFSIPVQLDSEMLFLFKIQTCKS